MPLGKKPSPTYHSLGVLSKEGVQPDPKTLHALTEIPLYFQKGITMLFD